MTMTKKNKTTEDQVAEVVATIEAPRDVMTVKQVADYLQVSDKAIYTLVKRGDIPAAKVADQWRFNRAVVDRWLTTLSLQEYKGPDLVTEGEVK
jgi:excisionase family DNA binding protein